MAEAPLEDERFETLFPTWVVKSTRDSVEAARGSGLAARQARTDAQAETGRWCVVPPPRSHGSSRQPVGMVGGSRCTI